MVLAKRDIYARLCNDNDLVITPLLDDVNQIGEASIDVRLGREFIVAKQTKISSLDPIRRSALERTIPLYQEKIKLDFGQPYILHPRQFVLASTLEFVSIPKDLMGYVVGRSSWGRLGLIIATATMVDPLYRGIITLELVNVGPIPIHLYPCSRIAQLVLHEVPRGEGTTDFDHKYQNSFEPSFSMIYRDKELPRVVEQPFQFAVGLTGLRGAGKSEVINYLTTDRNFRLFNISDLVIAEAKAQGLTTSRRALQDWGDDQRRRDNSRQRSRVPGSYFARNMVDIITEKCAPSDEFIVITGIRNPGEVVYLRQAIQNFFLVAITAPAKRRFTLRQIEGEKESQSEFEAADERDWGRAEQPWGQDIGRCIELAQKTDYGFVIENELGNKRVLRDRVKEILDEIQKKLHLEAVTAMRQDELTLRAKLSYSEGALLEEIGASLAETEGLDLKSVSPDALRQRAEQWLETQNDSFVQKICREWDFSRKVKDPRYLDNVLLASAIADLISGILSGVSPFTVAALLVKRGLENLCTQAR